MLPLIGGRTREIGPKIMLPVVGVRGCDGLCHLKGQEKANRVDSKLEALV